MMAMAQIASRRSPRPELVSARPPSLEAAALRLLSAERSEEVFPILLEEIVKLGSRRACVVMVDFDSGEIKPAASLNFQKDRLEKLKTSLWVSENPIVVALQAMAPAVLAPAAPGQELYYAIPICYRSRTRCWEAERERSQACLAVRNDQAPKSALTQQMCTVCDMRAYAGVVLVGMVRGTSETKLRELRAITDRANRHLSRLFKIEHYYNRMQEMDGTIARLRAVMQSMADPVILTDSQHRVIVQNRAAERFFGMPEGVSEGGRRAVELNNLLFSAALSSMAVSATDSSRDLTLVDVMEGEEVLFEAVCAPTFSAEGVRTGMVTVMRDVTDLRRADDEVRTNLEKLQAAEDLVRQDRDRLNLVIENVGDPIIVADNAAKVVLLDPLAKELFSPADTSKHPEIVKNQAKLDAYLTSFTFSFAEKENKSLLFYNPATRTEVEYAGRSGKIFDARNQVAYTVTVLRDFSTWKKLEQLQLERRMLEMEKFAATGRLAGTIAHEINNPLEAIKNAIHLLGDSVDSKSKPVYDVLKNETERVTRIVRQMLGLYRNVAQFAKFDLNAVVEDTLTLFAHPLSNAGVSIDKRLNPITLFKGSADQFRQLLSNLVVNARDSMPVGGHLVIRTKETHAKNSLHTTVHLTITDSGCGISADLRKSMFEPFVSTKGAKGTGLGLWIVKGIVENHSGRIRVRSSVGKGTVIRLAFPVVR